MSHTPGPWTFDGEQIEALDGDAVIAYMEPYMEPCMEPWGPDRDERLEQEANARLVTAAPDLLEVCKLAKKYLQPDLVEPGRTVFWALVEAIAKAEGSTPTARPTEPAE